MKTTLTVVILFLSIGLIAQGRNVPKMKAEFAKGYYVNLRGDSINCMVQTNPQDETAFHHLFKIKRGKSNRLKTLLPNVIKAYGLNGRHYERQEYKGQKIFLERLVSGRLNFYVYRYHGKVNGIPAIESSYFIKDTWNYELDKGNELNKISWQFYKKALKPYFKDQHELWDELDKFHFEQTSVVNAIRSFNNHYNTAMR